MTQLFCGTHFGPSSPAPHSPYVKYGSFAILTPLAKLHYHIKPLLLTKDYATITGESA